MDDGLSVQACRGHWHVTGAGHNIWAPGDPFSTEEDAWAGVATLRAIAAQNGSIKMDRWLDILMTLQYDLESYKYSQHLPIHKEIPELIEYLKAIR